MKTQTFFVEIEERLRQLEKRVQRLEVREKQQLVKNGQRQKTSC